MRITQTMVSRNLLDDLGDVTERLSRTQERLSSGKQLTAPSDDPFGVSQALMFRLDVSTQQQYQDQQAGQTQADIFGDDYQPGGVRNLRVGLQGDAGLTETAAAADTSLVLPNGVLVDVLA